MRCALVLATLAMLAFAAPAHAALAPPPTVLDFENAPLEPPFDGAFYAGAGATLDAPPRFGSFCGESETVSTRLAAAAPLQCPTWRDPGTTASARSPCNPAACSVIRFAAKQASVSMWVASFSDVTVEAWTGEPDASERVLPGAIATTRARSVAPR